MRATRAFFKWGQSSFSRLLAKARHNPRKAEASRGYFKKGQSHSQATLSVPFRGQYLFCSAISGAAILARKAATQFRE
jgi:hypothetical protein